MFNQLVNTQELLTPDYVIENDGLMLDWITDLSQLNNAKLILLNHFGFGGNNAAIILRKVA